MYHYYSGAFLQEEYNNDGDSAYDSNNESAYDLNDDSDGDIDIEGKLFTCMHGVSLNWVLMNTNHLVCMCVWGEFADQTPTPTYPTPIIIG